MGEHRGHADGDGEDSAAASKLELSLGGQGWLLALLQRCLQGYGNADFQKMKAKYGLHSKDELADKLIRVASHYALVAGGAAGGAATAAELSGLISGGASVVAGIGAVGTEILYVTRLQMRLVTDLAACYGRTLSQDDPEDLLTILYLGLGIASGLKADELVRQGGNLAARAALQQVFREGFGTKVFNDFKEWLGWRVGRRVVARRATLVIPVISVALGAGFNYTSTKAIGTLAKQWLRAGF